MAGRFATLELSDGIATVMLNRPDRHNALIPELLEDVRTAIGQARDADIHALVVTGAGRSFSTGGDIAGFLDAGKTPAGLRDYAGRIVGLLNAAILDLAAFPVPVIAAVNGPVTGGSFGLVLVADIVVMSADAFIQPYYSEVGFAPDGGWTAMLPGRIGCARTIEIQAQNRRLDADAADALGLVTEIAPAGSLDGAVGAVAGRLRTKDRDSLTAMRRLVWSEERVRQLAGRLEAERAAFVDLVGRPEVARRMTAFVQTTA